MWVACLRAQSCGVLLYYFSRLSFHRPVNCDGARPTRAFLPRAGACWRSGSAGARCQVHLLLCNTRCANPSACCWLWRGLPAAAGGHLSPRLRRGCFPVRRGWFPSLPSTCGGFDHLVLRSGARLDRACVACSAGQRQRRRGRARGAARAGPGAIRVPAARGQPAAEPGQCGRLRDHSAAHELPGRAERGAGRGPAWGLRRAALGACLVRPLQRRVQPGLARRQRRCRMQRGAAGPAAAAGLVHCGRPARGGPAAVAAAAGRRCRARPGSGRARARPA